MYFRIRRIRTRQSILGYICLMLYAERAERELRESSLKILVWKMNIGSSRQTWTGYMKKQTNKQTQTQISIAKKLWELRDRLETDLSRKDQDWVLCDGHTDRHYDSLSSWRRYPTATYLRTNGKKTQRFKSYRWYIFRDQEMSLIKKLYC